MNEIQSYLAPGLWLLWLLYWRATSKGVKPAVRRDSVGSHLVQVLALVIAGLLMLAPSTLFPGFGARFAPPWAGLYWVGVGLIALGLLFAVWARRCLGANWSSAVSIKEGHELVSTGAYALARHPIYTGLLTAFVGSALVLGEWRGVAAVAIVVPALWRKLAIEERWLLQEFGPAYEAYRRRVRAVIPFLL